MRPVLAELGDLGVRLELTPEGKSAACDAILDLITAVAAAPRRALGPALREAHGPGPSAIWLAGETAAPVAAAFANAFAAAALDLDDGHRRARGHPGACVLPAVLAMADLRDNAGEPPGDDEILRAIVVGYEIGLRIASARGFYARTGFWGGFAAAAGAGALARLDSERLAYALAIAGETGPHVATTTAAPAWPQPMGSDVKEGIAWGVATGVSAVPLARAGLTGPLDLIDHAPFFDATAILADRNGPAICESYTKFYAACRHVHAPVDALLGLIRAHGIDADEIDTVDVAAYSGALRISNRPEPQNLVDAQYSIPYCIGLAAYRGAGALLPMTNAALHDRAVEALAHRVRLSIDDACEARFPAETPVRVTIHARGTRFESAMTTPRGEATVAPTWNDRLEKFKVATRDSLMPDGRERLLDAFTALREGHLTPLRQLLASRLTPLPDG
jgi:2-methylcitrate dehydratase PrpD